MTSRGFKELVHMNTESTVKLQPIIVFLDGYRNYFERVYNYIAHNLYPGSSTSKGITQDDFVNVCKLVLKSRVDTVSFQVTGEHTEDRVKSMDGFLVPCAISVVINSIGLVKREQFEVYPVSEKPSDVHAVRIEDIVTTDILQRFRHFVMFARNAGFINISCIKNNPDGTAFWLLRVVDATTNIEAGSQSSLVFVESAFKMKGNEVAMASVVRNGFNGLIHPVEGLLWRTPNISEIRVWDQWLYSIKEDFSEGALKAV